ncbi:MAG: hypothetical protein PUB03_02905 [bacterium]|jgi:hypothetical protein|nr:hypothetical protein [bacterium]
MKNLGKFLKKNKMTVIVIICCLALTIILFALKLTFFPNEAKAIYGDRLDGLSEAKIKNSDLEQIESNLKEKDGVEKISTSTSGRILNVIITVKDDVSLESVKSFPDEVDKALDDDQKKAYDVQVFIKKNKEDDKFPVIAYRHQGGDHYSFTKDR